jgi:hypothetical protein
VLEVIGVPPSRSASILELFAANVIDRAARRDTLYVLRARLVRHPGRASRMVRAERISRMDTLAEAAIDESPRRR